MTADLLTPGTLAQEVFREIAGDLTVDDPGQMEYLTATESVAVQAAPGSGKTTLTALKLRALARGWLPTGRGICVLSHTNVAKDQLVGLVELDRYGRQLLERPHFIGTIQSFVDTYLGLPHARTLGYAPRHVDNDFYEREALRRLKTWRSLSKLRFFLAKRGDGDSLVATATWTAGPNGLEVRPESGSFPASDDTPTYLAYAKLKASMAQDGYFTFGDMYGLAEQLLTDHPDLARAVATRFPWVVVDESQDTDVRQQQLLERLFPPRLCTVQRVGDENQSIYDDPVTSTTPATIELPVSRRFGPQIAEVVSSLTILRPQTVVGQGNDACAQRLIVVFDEATADRVLPRFAAEAKQRLPDRGSDEPVVVAAGRTGESTAKKYPRTLACYSPPVAPRPSSSKAPRSLVEVVRQAQRQAQQGRQNEAFQTLMVGLASVAGLHGVSATHGGLTGPGLLRVLRSDRDPELEMSTRRLLRRLLERSSAPDAEAWESTIEEILALPLIVGRAATEGADAYMRYLDEKNLPEPVPNPGQSGLIVSSIHGIKGETHAATLMVECLDKGGTVHDVVEALRLICHTATADQLSKSGRKVCRLAFVALSRPRSLLGLAVLDNHIEPFEETLRASGWEFVDVRDHATG
jgi:DNA helicase-2/ATP-dependent DNA helicase PcrA